MYPGSIPSYAGFTGSHTLSADNHASQHNSEQADISALATKLGTGASTPTSGMLLRGNGVGTSTWGQAVLTSDVSGVLPVANGGLGQGSLSGLTLPSAILTASPTITTPTIASFINSVHNHEANAGGGTLNAANALQAGSVNFANLLSTIFSGQVQTQVNAGTAGGTMNYINLGGIKLLWMITAVQTVGTGGATWTVTFPTSFFTGVTTVILGLGVLGNTFNQIASLNGVTTTTLTFNQWAVANGSTQSTEIFVIGT